MNSTYIESNKKFWGPEFSEVLGIPYFVQHNEIAAMGCYTMLYHIADNFRDGQFRDEILNMCGVK